MVSEKGVENFPEDNTISIVEEQDKASNAQVTIQKHMANIPPPISLAGPIPPLNEGPESLKNISKIEVSQISGRNEMVKLSSKFIPTIRTNMSIPEGRTHAWKAYEGAPNELAITTCVGPSFYKFRWMIFKIFNKKFPLVRYTIGFVLMVTARL